MLDVKREEEAGSLATGSPDRGAIVNTTCAYCGVGCGVEVQSSTSTPTPSSAQLSLKGTAEHPANHGRLCVKGSKLLETNDLNDRLLQPQINGLAVDWHAATDLVASKFNQIIQQHGPESVAFYVSGQLLTEDYYVANKLMKGFIGSGNIDTNSRLCMSSAVAAYKRAFGADCVPCCYEDLEQTDLLVLVGSNAAWTHPVLFQRMEKARQINPDLKIVFIDPRKTASCESADLHLALMPGTDVALYNGLLNYLEQQAKLDHDYITNHTEGFDIALATAKRWTVEKVAQICDLPIDKLVMFYSLFASSDRAVSFYSMGVNQASSGVDKGNAIINCHLASGKIGRIGCGPFSITGQPNAMGGREVGGLSNMLAAHMDIDNTKHRQIVRRFWQSPNLVEKAGLKAVDLFDAMEQGKIKAVWIMATNPAVSMPNRGKICRALEKCEFVVVSDCVAKNDTLGFADVKLPATAWSEKDGTVTNSERCISRQRSFLPAPGEAKHDWQIICEVARKMGFEQGFNFTHPQQIFVEHARLSGFENQGKRDFDISALATLSQQQYERMKPIQWPVNLANPSGRKRMFTDGKYYTDSGKARFMPIAYRPPKQSTCERFPLVLNSGRIRDQWHTMTRTGKAVALTRHVSQPFVTIHPEDARHFMLNDGDIVTIRSRQTVDNTHIDDGHDQAIQLEVNIGQGQRRGELFVPIHWSRVNASSAAIGSLFGDVCDPISGQPELKHGAVAIQKVHYANRGQLFFRHTLPVDSLTTNLEYWVCTPIAGGFVYRFASNQQLETLYQWLQTLYPVSGEWLLKDSDDYSYFAAMQDGELRAAGFMSNQLTEVDVRWIETLFKQNVLDSRQISALLNAKPDDRFVQGRLVCSCFSVAENTISKAIASGCDSVEALGAKLKCGTNCGSCKSELQQLINAHKTARFAGDSIITVEAI